MILQMYRSLQMSPGGQLDGGTTVHSIGASEEAVRHVDGQLAEQSCPYSLLCAYFNGSARSASRFKNVILIHGMEMHGVLGISSRHDPCPNFENDFQLRLIGQTQSAKLTPYGACALPPRSPLPMLSNGSKPGESISHSRAGRGGPS
jgi:hypothetical protein